MAVAFSRVKSQVCAIDRNWDQACQAFVRMISALSGGTGHGYLSANEAYRASKIISKNPNSAPKNAVHYWAIGAYGHVAWGLGGSKVAMASKYVDKFWPGPGENIGETTVQRYTARTGATYRGWAYSNGVNKLAVSFPAAAPSDVQKVKKVAAFLNKQNLGHKTTADQDGVRGEVYWLLIQLYGRKIGTYPAPKLLDGDPAGSDSTTRKVEAALIAKLT